MLFIRLIVSTFTTPPAGVPIPPIVAPIGTPIINNFPKFDFPGKQSLSFSTSIANAPKIIAVGMSARTEETSPLANI